MAEHTRPPPPKRDKIALILLFGFGALALAMSAWQWSVVLRNPEPTELECTQAVAELGRGRWVEVAGCEVAFGQMIEEFRDDELKRVYFPLYPPNRADNEPVAFLSSNHPALLDELATASDELAIEAAAREYLDLDPVRGVTSALHLRDSERFGDGELSGPAADYVEIEDEAPDSQLAAVLGLIGLLLVGIGGYKTWRSRAPQAGAPTL